jgi:hypothetical protein
VKVVEPGTDGVPVMVPLESRLSPAGKVPPLSDQGYVGVPPLAARLRRPSAMAKGDGARADPCSLLFRPRPRRVPIWSCLVRPAVVRNKSQGFAVSRFSHERGDVLAKPIRLVGEVLAA